MNFKKNMRAGYQGKQDSMRELADRLMNHPGEAADVYESKSAANKSRMRAYKTGGSVKKKPVQKFAMGGVAKIRHGEATAKGLPKAGKKKCLKDVL
jgi:hypothetical protein